MFDDYLFCNYKGCNAPITKFTWVTRCSHVFCEEHGDKFFINKTSKIRCPVCNESIVGETDTIKTNLNPHDMMLSCVKPDKALNYVANALKLWSYQMKQKNKVNIALLSEKYEKIASTSMSKLKTENIEMKKFIKEIESKLKNINTELAYTKKKLWKYKLAYNNVCLINEKSPVDTDQNRKFSADTFNNDFEDVLQYGDFNNFDDAMSPKFD